MVQYAGHVLSPTLANTLLAHQVEETPARQFQRRENSELDPEDSTQPRGEDTHACINAVSSPQIVHPHALRQTAHLPLSSKMSIR